MGGHSGGFARSKVLPEKPGDPASAREQQLKPVAAACEFVERAEMDFMGYSIWSGGYRYTEWCGAKVKLG